MVSLESSEILAIEREGGKDGRDEGAVLLTSDSPEDGRAGVSCTEFTCHELGIILIVKVSNLRPKEVILRHQSDMA